MTRNHALRLSALLAPLALVLALSLAPMRAGAATLTWSLAGTLEEDDGIVLVPFSLPGPAQVTIASLGYAGGTNAAGIGILRGGFDTILALFDAAGALLGQNDDGGANVSADALTGATFDAYLALVLAAGDYTLAITQFDSFARGPALGDGFERKGAGPFTTAFGCPDAQARFNDTSGVPGCGRTGAYAVDIVADVPEPASAALLALPVLGLAAARRRFR